MAHNDLWTRLQALGLITDQDAYRYRNGRTPTIKSLKTWQEKTGHTFSLNRQGEFMSASIDKERLLEELDCQPHELHYRDEFIVRDLASGEEWNQPGWYYTPFGENERFLGRSADSILANM